MRALYDRHVCGIRSVPLLDHIDYVKEDAKLILVKEFGWRDYGGKHHESIFTRFYQTYFLPTKFGIDKRKSHLSTLVCSGQLAREAALEEMKKPIASPEQIASDKDYVLKKLALSEAEFAEIMGRPAKHHLDYPSHLSIYRRLRPLKTLLRKLRAAPVGES